MRGSSIAVVLIVVLLVGLQLVVVVELVGADHQVAHSLIGRQGDRQRWGLVALLAAPLQGQAHRIGMGHLTGQGLGDPRLEIGGTIAIEQA
jgi:hypothetical protein